MSGFTFGQEPGFCEYAKAEQDRLWGFSLEVRTASGSELPEILGALKKGDSLELSIDGTFTPDRYIITENGITYYPSCRLAGTQFLSMEQAQKKIKNSLSRNTITIRRKTQA